MKINLSEIVLFNGLCIKSLISHLFILEKDTNFSRKSLTLSGKSCILSVGKAQREQEPRTTERKRQDMLKKNIEELAWWIYNLSGWLWDYDQPESWWSEERYAQWNEDTDESMYLSEILCREIMALTK